MKPTQSKYKQRQKDKPTELNEIERNPQINHTKIQNPQTNLHNSIDILLIQHLATPNKKGKHTTHLNIKKFIYNSLITSTSLPHSGSISFVVYFLSQPRKSPIRVCPNWRMEILQDTHHWLKRKLNISNYYHCLTVHFGQNKLCFFSYEWAPWTVKRDPPPAQ